MFEADQGYRLFDDFVSTVAAAADGKDISDSTIEAACIEVYGSYERFARRNAAAITEFMAVLQSAAEPPKEKTFKRRAEVLRPAMEYILNQVVKSGSS
jgi:uncharacterized protein (DUF1778 family)